MGALDRLGYAPRERPATPRSRQTGAGDRPRLTFAHPLPIRAPDMWPPPVRWPLLFQIEVMSDEAHFPAKPPRARTPPRLPGAVGDAGRTQDIGSPPGTGPQDSFGLIPASL